MGQALVRLSHKYTKKFFGVRYVYRKHHPSHISLQTSLSLIILPHF